MIKVRKACEEDLEALVALINDFYTKHNFAFLSLELDLEVSKTVAKNLIEKHIALVLEAKDNYIVGGIGGIETNFILNPKIRMFHEVFFYVRDGFRKYTETLLKELVKECQRRKLDRIIMAHPNDGTMDQMKRFYGAREFKVLEMHFIRRLNQ